MGAVASQGTLAERVTKAIEAGADIALWVSSEADSLAVCKRL
jgi:beta-glucosidase-like glycosyl hydrolase